MTSLRGVGGAGRGVSDGSGDGVRDRENMLDIFGSSMRLGLGTDKLEWASGVEGGGRSKEVENEMTDADSANSVSPTL